jgi:hypothetical protein
MCTLHTSSDTARSHGNRGNLSVRLRRTQTSFNEKRLRWAHWLRSKPFPASLSLSIRASPATKKTVRFSIVVIAAALSLATTGLAMAERGHVKQQRLAAGGGHQVQSHAGRGANEKVAGSALAPSEQLGTRPDELSSKSVGRVPRAVMPTSHVDYDLTPESVAGSSEP